MTTNYDTVALSDLTLMRTVHGKGSVIC